MLMSGFLHNYITGSGYLLEFDHYLLFYYLYFTGVY